MDELANDVYPQPVDPMHLQWATEFINFINQEIGLNGKCVIDAGCGVAFVAPIFEGLGADYWGMTMDFEDIRLSQSPEKIIVKDFHFLGQPYPEPDIIFSRHSLEHSPMPLLALMEWHRIAPYLCLVLPRPECFMDTGRNHYSVLSETQANFLLQRAGWFVIATQHTQEEFRFICKADIRKNPFYA